jgi:hypothetical protein
MITGHRGQFVFVQCFKSIGPFVTGTIIDVTGPIVDYILLLDASANNNKRHAGTV